VDSELKIYFEASKDDNTTFSSSPPFKNFVIKLILPKRDRTQYNNSSAAIDASFFFKNEQRLDRHFDLIIELRPLTNYNINSILAIYCISLKKKQVTKRTILKQRLYYKSSGYKETGTE
jgi:hypothetical protein